jgi:hypothetical protein
MVLYHVTHRRNVASIERLGLLPEKATGREKSIWLVSRTMVPWALGHTAAKPGKGPITKLVVYKIETTRSRVRRFRRGIWRSFETIIPVGCEPASAWTLAYPDEHPR